MKNKIIDTDKDSLIAIKINTNKKNVKQENKLLKIHLHKQTKNKYINTQTDTKQWKNYISLK